MSVESLDPDGMERGASRYLLGQSLPRFHAFGEELGREPLSLGDSLDLDRDRVDRLLHSLEPRCRDSCGRRRLVLRLDPFAARTLSRWDADDGRRDAHEQRDRTIITTLIASVPPTPLRLPSTGSTNRISVPAPTCCSRPHWPSCASTVCRAIASPRPVPPGLDVTYGSQMRARLVARNAAPGVRDRDLHRISAIRLGAADANAHAPTAACTRRPR